MGLFSFLNPGNKDEAVVKNPLYDPSSIASNRYVSPSSLLTVGLNPVDNKIQTLAGSSKISDLLQMGNTNFNQFSPAWKNALAGTSLDANGRLVRSNQPQQTTQPTNQPAGNNPTVTSPGRGTSGITAPVQNNPAGAPATPSYDPSVTGQAVDPNRLSPSDLKDLATRAGQAGLSLSDYTELVNRNAGLTSDDAANIRKDLGIDEAKDRVFKAPKESLEDVYRNLYKNVGLKDVKKSIADLDARINQKRDDFNKVEGEIKNNPWLSSASRRGRLANAATLALNDISNDLTERQQYLDLYDQGVSEIEKQLGYIISDRNLQRELDTNELNFLLNEAERKEGLVVSDRTIDGLRNVPDFIAGRRDEQLRLEANERAAAAAKIASNAVEVPVLRIGENGAVVQGTEPPKAPNSTEQGTLLFFQRMAEAVQNLEEVEGDITKQGFIGQAQMKAFDAPLLLTSAQQRYEQAARQFTEARLRKDSGAAIPESEFENDRLTYFPQPGDDAASLAQKKAARETALNGLRVASGNAYWQLYGVSPIEETVARLQSGGNTANAASPADDAYAASLKLDK